MTGDLVERLLARIDEREKLYRQLIERPCAYVGMNIMGVTRTLPVGLGLFGIDQHELLRTIQAHRKIIELHEGSHECSQYRGDDIDRCTWVLDDETCSTLAAVASIYFPEGTEPT